MFLPVCYLFSPLLLHFASDNCSLYDSPKSSYTLVKSLESPSRPFILVYFFLLSFSSVRVCGCHSWPSLSITNKA